MKDKKLTKHHVIPRSRMKGIEENNIVLITHIEHDRYHQLFSNRTPEEILHYLVNVFWGGKVSYLYEYLNEIQDQ